MKMRRPKFGFAQTVVTCLEVQRGGLPAEEHGTPVDCKMAPDARELLRELTLEYLKLPEVNCSYQVRIEVWCAF